ncbi:interferon-induced protein with tetratricopeptide repeats 5-like [Larimichthys crocea]|uniref:interferon-induced protein with tetratricopeptide repeats 5-like n=1 Tax=Larimichthys crocea TaxID=215358 RepID=UPI000F5EF2A1|nr:interferon-induced protein with tetratricopeptide repeats 5-like [Larimichthys crocea]
MVLQLLKEQKARKRLTLRKHNEFTCSSFYLTFTPLFINLDLTRIKRQPYAAQSPTTPKSKLEALQCHFTWDLDRSRSKPFCLRDSIEDIGTEEGNSWLGHIYNLQGFIQYKLGFTEDAQSLFNKAAEAFSQTRGAAEGPWLVVNYGNLAWLHHHLGDQAESQAYLSKVDALMEKYPSPSQDELHPEIYAEKAWTLMKFSTDKRLLAADYFQRAIRMQPDMVEWNTSQILALVTAANHNKEEELGADVFEKMRIAKKQDPENLYLAALYLEQRAKRGERVEDEARELSRKVLRNPVSSYSGLTPLLRLYRVHISMTEAVKLVEEALKEHPGARYLKWCAANCYKWKVQDSADSIEVERAISLCKEVIELYPDSSFKIKIGLAGIYGKWNRQKEAHETYEELLQRKDLDAAETEQLSRKSRRFFKNLEQDHHRPIQHQTEVKAETPQQSVNQPIGSFVGGASESWKRLISEK